MLWFLAALLAAFFWGVAPVFAKLGLARVDPLTALSIRTVGVAGSLFLINLFTRQVAVFRSLGTKTWLFLLAEGICASLLGHYAYLVALKHGSASSVAPVTAAYPIIAVLAGALILRETLTPGKAIGGALIVLGIFLIRRF